MTNQISKNFTFSEFEYSQKAKEAGIDNTIKEENIRWAIRLLVINILQPLRNFLKVPLVINSGYRCQELNDYIHGANNSQHTKGEAADVLTDDPLLFAQSVKKLELPFDQMILYPNFVHISHKPYGPQRKQILYNKSYILEYPKIPNL